MRYPPSLTQTKEIFRTWSSVMYHVRSCTGYKIKPAGQTSFIVLVMASVFDKLTSSDALDGYADTHCSQYRNSIESNSKVLRRSYGSASSDSSGRGALSKLGQRYD